MKQETTFDRLFQRLDEIIKLQKQILTKLDGNSDILHFPTAFPTSFHTECIGKEIETTTKNDENFPYCDK